MSTEIFHDTGNSVCGSHMRIVGRVISTLCIPCLATDFQNKMLFNLLLYKSHYPAIYNFIFYFTWLLNAYNESPEMLWTLSTQSTGKVGQSVGWGIKYVPIPTLFFAHFSYIHLIHWLHFLNLLCITLPTCVV